MPASVCSPRIFQFAANDAAPGKRLPARRLFSSRLLLLLVRRLRNGLERARPKRDTLSLLTALVAISPHHRLCRLRNDRACPRPRGGIDSPGASRRLRALYWRRPGVIGSINAGRRVMVRDEADAYARHVACAVCAIGVWVLVEYLIFQAAGAP
jgi:hypothetical protein